MVRAESPASRSSPQRHLGAAAVVCLVAILLPAPAASGSTFPDIPHVENLTEGFRIEATFSTVAVAPSDPDRIYLGTENGFVYSSTDGGDTWDQHDVIELPRKPRIQLMPRTGLSLDFSEFPYAGTGPNPHAERYVRGYHWPGRVGGTFDSLQLAELSRPESFRPSKTIRSELTVADEFAGETLNRLEVRGLSMIQQPVMAPDLGYGRPAYQEFDSGEQLEIRWLVIHPDDADILFAVTNDGLWRSNDGGYSWKREFDRAQPSSREIGDLTFAPEDPEVRFLCTDSGLFVTRNDGRSYSKVSAAILNRIPCNWIEFHPERPRELWVGAVFGLWVSDDFGTTFDLVFGRRVRGKKAVRQVRFDPNNPDNILVASAEFGFLSRDGGETFDQLGTFSFGNQRLSTTLFGEEPGTLLVLTRRDLWRSTDWGGTWQSIMFGNVGWSLRHAIYPRGRDGPLWLLTDGELLSLERRPPTDMTSQQAADLQRKFRREPSLTATLVQALKSRGVWRPRLRDYRQRAETSHLVPNLQVVGTYRDIEGQFTGRGRLYGRPGADDQLPRGLGSQPRFQDFHLEIWGNWDLSELVFDRRSLPTGRSFEYNRQLAQSTRESVQLVYNERRRLQIKQVVRPADSLRTRLFRRLRIRELTELLDIMTDEWFSRYTDAPAVPDR